MGPVGPEKPFLEKGLRKRAGPNPTEHSTRECMGPVGFEEPF